MKLLFSSSDVPAVALFKSVLVRADIRCEIRHQDTPEARREMPDYPELWVNEADFFAASMLFASRRRRYAPSLSHYAG